MLTLQLVFLFVIGNPSLSVFQQGGQVIGTGTGTGSLVCRFLNWRDNPPDHQQPSGLHHRPCRRPLLTPLH